LSKGPFFHCPASKHLCVSICKTALASEDAEALIPRPLLAFFMSARQPGPYDDVARKWLDLAERRRAYVVELRDSGRWKHYYTPEQLLEVMREVIRTRDRWAKLAGLEDGQAAA
jgi:hypothetical protein